MKGKKSKYPSEHNFVIQAYRQGNTNWEDTIYGVNKISEAEKEIERIKTEKRFLAKTKFRVVKAIKKLS